MNDKRQHWLQGRQFFFEQEIADSPEKRNMEVYSVVRALHKFLEEL